MARRKSAGSIVFDGFNYIFMVAFCITILIPFWDMIVMSFSPAKYSYSLTLRLWPQFWSVEAYKFAFRNDSIVRAYGITIARTVIGVIFSLFCTTCMAYGLSKKQLPGHNFLTTFILIPMFFGGGLIPTYLLMRGLGLVDTFWIYVIPSAVGSYNVILLRNYFQNMDITLEEAAIIDGATNMRVMLQIVVPLAKPIIATLALWSMVGHWNAWIDTLIYVRDKSLYTLQFVLRRMLVDDRTMNDEMLVYMMQKSENETFLTKNLQAAITIITIGPIILVYPFLQKYFVKGIMIGALKG